MKIRYRWLISFLCMPICMANSLWPQSQSNRGMFVDVRARAIGDIVTVTLENDVTIPASVGMDNPREKFPFIKRILDIFRTTRLDDGRLSLPSTPGHNEAIYAKTTLPMQVMDVLPNGNLVLEGIRKYKISDVYQYEALHGIARQQDISAENTLDIFNLSNLTIDTGWGTSLENAKKNGLVTRLNNLLDPY